MALAWRKPTAAGMQSCMPAGTQYLTASQASQSCMRGQGRAVHHATHSVVLWVKNTLLARVSKPA